MTAGGAANVEAVEAGRLYDPAEEAVARTVQSAEEAMLHTGHNLQAQLPLRWIFRQQTGRHSDRDHTHRHPGQLSPHRGPLEAESVGLELGVHLTIGGEAVVVELEEAVEQPAELK